MDRILGIFIISGKRHTGKDFLSLRLQTYIRDVLGQNCQFLSGSKVLKHEFCRDNGLDIVKMLNDRSYKEEHRAKMTQYYYDVLSKKGIDYCNQQLVGEMLSVSEPTYFILDIRYRFEIDCYVKHGLDPLMTKIRINVVDEIKQKRGWVSNPEIDNDASEIELDSYDAWDYVFDNSTDGTVNIDIFIENLFI
jgi:phosphomevalonate kinase